MKLLTKADPYDHTVFSNRSAVKLVLEDFQGALEDAERVIELKPDWARGYFRKANAL